MDMAVVTGGGTGIGRALCVALAERGLTVLAVGRRAEPLQALATEFPGGVEPVVADVATPAGRETIASAVGTSRQLRFLVHNAGIVIMMAILSSMVFSLGGLINGIYAKRFDDISFIPTFVLTPLTYLGGVFYSIDLLPGFWQGVSRLNPILYMVNAFRFGMLGHSDISLSMAYAMMLLAIVVGIGWALWLLERGTGLRS